MMGALLFLRRHGLMLMVGLLFGYLALHILSSKQGLFKLAAHERTIADLQDDIAQTKAKRLGLEKRAQSLRASSLSADLLDEQARRELGYSHMNDLVIILDD